MIYFCKKNNFWWRKGIVDSKKQLSKKGSILINCVGRSIQNYRPFKYTFTARISVTTRKNKNKTKIVNTEFWPHHTFLPRM